MSPPFNTTTRVAFARRRRMIQIDESRRGGCAEGSDTSFATTPTTARSRSVPVVGRGGASAAARRNPAFAPELRLVTVVLKLSFCVTVVLFQILLFVAFFSAAMSYVEIAQASDDVCYVFDMPVQCV